MKKSISLLFVLFVVLTSTANSQWWVDGGNLIWPNGNVEVTNGNIISRNSEIIQFSFDKNGDDSECNFSLYRNDTETTVDTVYWSGGSYGQQYFLEFSDGIIGATTQDITYNTNYVSCYTDSGFILASPSIMRSGADNKILLTFKDSSGNNIDVFTVSVKITIFIYPSTKIQSIYYSW